MTSQRIQSFINQLQTYQSYRPSASIRRIIVTLAILLLLGGLMLSVRDNPALLSNINWHALSLVMLVGVPLTALLNALEFQVSAHMAGKSFPFVGAIRVAVFGSAANMLPLPGSVMVRVTALTYHGVSFKKGAAVTLLVALLWVGMAFCYAGLMMVWLAPGVMAWSVVVAGTLILAGGGLVFRSADLGGRSFGMIMIIKFLMVLIDAARFYLCFLALGVDVMFAQASALVISSVLGSAVSIVPAGLGIREVFSAGIAPMVGLAASSGFLAATLNRVAGLAALVPLSLILLSIGRQKGPFNK